MLTFIYTSLFSLGLAYLFLQVVKYRRKDKVTFGDGGSDMVIRARSIHSNYVETVPFILLLMFLMETSGYPAWLIHIFGLGMIASRGFHFYAIFNGGGAGKFRVYAGVTFITLLIAGSVLLLVKQFV